jgi:hypothetical protein
VVTTTTTTAPLPQPGTTGLVVLRTQDAGVEDAEPLHGAVLDGRVAIYFADRSARRVVFHLDDPTGSGPPFNVDERWPFTLVGQVVEGAGGTLDTTGLADGEHSVRADVTLADGSTSLRLAVFTVDN